MLGKGRCVMKTPKRHDVVVCKSMPDGPLGTVKRIARDGSWADVFWHGGLNHSKRMKTEHITVKYWTRIGRAQ